MNNFKKNQHGGFSIIELLLVLTALAIFLGAAFIGYRTMKANGNEEQMADKFKNFVTGLKSYSKDFYNEYPYISCTQASDWSVKSSNNNIASCGALEQYIGSFVTEGPSSTNIWIYQSYSGLGTPTSELVSTSTCITIPANGFGTLDGITLHNSSPDSVEVCIGTQTNATGTPATSPSGTAGPGQGYYTITIPPIDNSYVASVLTKANVYGLVCSITPYNSGSSVISCISQPVEVGGVNSVNDF